MPFLKVDKGLVEQDHGVQLMKEMPHLDTLLNTAILNNVFGTKMRAVIHEANPYGIKCLVEQQFSIAQEIMQLGLVPIIEPEISITSGEKQAAESILFDQIIESLEKLKKGSQVILKLTLPEEAQLYSPLVSHPSVLRVLALSGGYSLNEACEKLSSNRGVIASFSRALCNSLNLSQSDEAFSDSLGSTINTIYDSCN